MIFISSHARFSDTGQLVNGTSSQLTAFLKKQKIPFYSLYHSLFAGFPTLYINNKNKEKKIGLQFLPFGLKLLQDAVVTIIFVLQHKKNIHIFIGINPINASIGCLLKKIGVCNRVVYYTADFSPKRFANPLLNSFYLFLDDFSVRNADAVWNVSTRIQQERINKFGNLQKFVVLPNSIPYPKFIENKRRDKYALVLVTHMTKSIHFNMLIDAIDELIIKYPQITLRIVGDGYEKKRVEQTVIQKKLQKHIIFYGHMKYENVIKLLKKSGIGLGIYTNDNSWTKYGDSMKVREYVAYGLPVIITNVPSTAEDVKKYNAGVIIKQNKKEFVLAVRTILSEKYVLFQENALKMAKENDYEKLLAKTLKNL